MDEKILDEIEQIKFHQDVIVKDATSPLYQIREKELEIHGRILAARSEAEKIVADARQKAAEIVRNAEAEAERRAKEHADQVLAQAQAEVESVKKEGEAATADLEKTLTARQNEAVDFVVKLVVGG